MMKFIWDPKYSVNIKSIDTQHQRFFEIINAVYYLIGTKQVDRDKLLKVIRELDDYITFHLNFEEKYFTEFAYDDTEEHLQSHNDFRRTVKNYFDQINQPDSDIATLANKMAEFTQTWLCDHILNTDHKYIGCFLKNDLR